MRFVAAVLTLQISLAGCVPSNRRPTPKSYLQDPIRGRIATAASGQAPTPQPQPVSSGEPLRAPGLAGQSVVREAVSDVPPAEEPLRRAFANERPKRSFVGRATYYHDSFAGRVTACGDEYDPTAFTAAHKTLPFGTVLRVVNPGSGQDVYVRVNDRGPFGDRKTGIGSIKSSGGKSGPISHGGDESPRGSPCVRRFEARSLRTLRSAARALYASRSQVTCPYSSLLRWPWRASS